MKGFTEKDGVLVIVFANNLIYKWQKFQPSQTSPSVFPLEIAYLVQKLWNFWYQVKILVFLHHLQKEWVLFYLKWAWNECLHLRTSEMSIDMGRRIVHCLATHLEANFFLPGLLAIRCGHEACQGDVVKKQCDFLPPKKRLTNDKSSWASVD